MPTSDAFVVGENWLSEHYFTTDATSESFQAEVIKRRKGWEELKSADHHTDRSRFTEARARLLSELSGLAESPRNGPAVYAEIKRVLGYDSGGYSITHSGPVQFLSATWAEGGSALALLHASPTDSVDDLLEKDKETLLEPYVLEDGTRYTSVARTLSNLFVAEDAPPFALVFAGQWLLLAERERWAEGRYLAVNLLLVAERNDDKRGGEIDRALAVLSRESLAPDAEGAIWWTGILEQSIKHTVGVSKDLREGIRLSIEIIANDVLVRRRLVGLPDDEVDPQLLARQALRFLYRVLFLLYAEASPELGVLPAGAAEYERGYGLDRLRDLTLVELNGPSSAAGTHIYESLAMLFRLVDEGHAGPVTTPGESDYQERGSIRAPGLSFDSLKADLFLPDAIGLIGQVKLGNESMQQVLQHLLLSKATKSRDRGFISYAELGINQLGAVYEGLMSYTGFIAESDLYEVAKGGDSSRGSWVVPVERAESIGEKDFVRTIDAETGEPKRVLHNEGTFVYRLAGRERQQSASYYTPEVLTKFVVSQALEELLDQNGTTTAAADILNLTVCEPALGSGAFAIEAVRQLAEQYLQRRQRELDERIEPDDYPRRLQEVKAYLALHQVYGVDLNATAVELAEISLWLDTMVKGLEAPWFGLHLKRGNSLIGARRAVFTEREVASKAHLLGTPADVPVAELSANLAADRGAMETSGKIYHFLLPSAGWGSAVEGKEARELASDATRTLRAWRNTVRAKLTKAQTRELVNLSHRVEALWQLSLRRLTLAESQIRREVHVWGAYDLPVGGLVTRRQIESSLADANGAYRRLRRVMDAWTALWYWPLDEPESPPTIDQWLIAMQGLLGRHQEQKSRAIIHGAVTLGSGGDWDDLNDAEEADLSFAGVSDVSELLQMHPWLRACERVAEVQGFFHWELEFAPVFAHGGFDLQIGNPPWVRPRSDVPALLAEADPWFQLVTKPTEEQFAAKREDALRDPAIKELLVGATSDVASLASFVGAAQNYPALAGLQPDLYRCFMHTVWRNSGRGGVAGMLHPDSHFTDEKAGLLRQETYLRIRRHWQFINSLYLFSEIDDHTVFGVHVYGDLSPATKFLHAATLFAPETVTRSLVHDGTGEAPGVKDGDGNWDLRPHRERIIEVNDEVLKTWHAVLESELIPTRQARMLYTVNRASSDVLDKLARQPRVAELGLEFSAGWHEKNDRTKGFIEVGWGRPDTWADVILQGPHLFVSTPMYKTPNSTMLHNQDWTATDFETLGPDAIPVTSYKPAGDRVTYDKSYTRWGQTGDVDPRNHFRIAWRRMAATTGERTLIPTLIPPGTAHVNGVSVMGSADVSARDLVVTAGMMSSLVADFFIRTIPKSDVLPGTIARLPRLQESPLIDALLLRTLRLNCVVDAYSTLWSKSYSQRFVEDSWAGPFGSETRIGNVSSEWNAAVPLRAAADRRRALVEIDAIVALSLGLTADELVEIYRSQFGVLAKYERARLYDASGRLVPGSIASEYVQNGGVLSEKERTLQLGDGTTHVYISPFQWTDRATEMKVAYSHFERSLGVPS